MAKPRVESAPKFDMATFDFAKALPFMQQYHETDDKGRYLHWHQLKWRVPQKHAKFC